MPPRVKGEPGAINNAEPKHRQIEADQTVEERLRHIHPEDLEIEVLANVARLEEDRVVQVQLPLHVAVEDEREHARPTRPQRVVEHGKPVSEESLSRVTIEEHEVQLAEDQYHVLIEVVTDEVANATVSLTTMH